MLNLISSIGIQRLACMHRCKSLILLCARTVSDCRHGFNKQTPRFFVLDQIKHLLLSLALSLPIGAAVIWIVKAGGPFFYFYLWAFLFAVQVLS